MKAFVTGGTGFVGSHLVEHLLKLPELEEVRVLVRNKEKWLKGLDYTPVKSTLKKSYTGLMYSSMGRPFCMLQAILIFLKPM